MLKELIAFTIKEARACVFAGSFFVLLFASNHVYLFGLHRYDFIFIGALLIQAFLIWKKIESWDEVKVIMLFHLVGLVLEIFKTQPEIGSWSYPEPGFFKVMGVPLFSGFMYSAVGSYISQAWNVLKLRVENYPKYIYSVPLSVAVYLNFFTHHFIVDVRWFLFVLIVVVFSKTVVYFTPLDKERSLPMLVSFGLIAFFIWIAENISSYLGAYEYPNQVQTWDWVSFNKMGSWFLLVIISVIIVFDLKIYKQMKNPDH